MKLCLFLVATLLAVSPLWAQRQMSVNQLEQFVRSSIAQKHKDGEVADVLKNVRMTEKLDARVVENLQGLGAGPKTVAALRALVPLSASLANAAPPPPKAPALPPIPIPSEAEQKRIIADVTKYALDYTKSLPNFICTQITRRAAGSLNGGLRPQDIIQEQLSFVEGKENYKVVMVNSQLTPSLEHNQVGGAVSSGEFGSRLHDIFKPESKTTLVWERWATLRGRRMHKIVYRVDQKNSEFSVYDQGSGRHLVAGYHGEVFVDAETKAVMRIQLTLDGLENFPVRHVDQTLDYDFVDISGQQFVLPVRAELNSRMVDYQSQNVTEFRRYSKFGAEATIIYDTSAEMPKEKVEEEPIR
jgi:hypothetical protein